MVGEPNQCTIYIILTKTCHARTIGKSYTKNPGRIYRILLIGLVEVTTTEQQ